MTLGVTLVGRQTYTTAKCWTDEQCGASEGARYALRAFVELGRRIRKNLAGIEAALLHSLSNALIESTNTKIRVLTRVAYGFKEPEHLIALALLDRGGYCPPLPGRSAA